MNHNTKRVTAIFIFISVAAISSVTSASARGGAAAYIMNSPGYQRALQESRQRYRESYYAQPSVRPPGASPRKTWRHKSKR